MEQLTLTTAESVADFQVVRLVFDWEQAAIKVVVRNTTTNKRVKAGYSGDIATTLMIQLNKADLSTNSLHKRVLERLVTDGFLPAGSVTGSPD